jgi:nucleoside-diphosphate-sugar epimerase
MKERILPTGINGFVGTNFTNAWKGNHSLFGLDIHQPDKEGVERTFGWEEMGKIPPVDAIIHLAGKAHDTNNRSEAKSGIYHVGDDEPISTNELIALISESVGKKARIWKLPKGWMNAAAGLGDVLHLPLNRQRLQKLTENYVVSNDKVKQALGISSLPVSARDGMRRTLESFR